MRLKILLESAGCSFNPVRDTEVTGVFSDSAKVLPGGVFVAIRGLHTDGADFAEEAVKNGAVLMVAEREIQGVPCFVVPNAREALARLLDAFWGHPAKELCLVGITGTNGKTSVSMMLYHILRMAGYTCGLIGTVECRIGDEVYHPENADHLANMTTPDPAELYPLLATMRDAGVTHVVMEVTSHALAFSKVAPLEFRLAVFTNLTEDHLDLHGDMERYFAEKRKLFSMCRQAVISTSTVYGKILADTVQVPCLAVSAGKSLLNIRKDEDRGVEFSLCRQGETIPFYLPVPGDFSVENGALAAAGALCLGVAAEIVQKALAVFPGVPGRLERVSGIPADFSVFLDYAHTPDALEKLLRSARGFGGGRRIVLLFGCGGDRERGKRAQMGRIASRFADFLILTSDNCRSEKPEAILADILRGVDKEKPYIVISDRREAIRYAVLHAEPGDILLLAGKGHETYEIRGKQRLPFSEREIVRESFAERTAGNEN